MGDPAFFAPFVLFFDPRRGRPSTPMESSLRLMFLKFRYRHATVRRITGQLAGIAKHAARDARRLLVNARRALARAAAKVADLADCAARSMTWWR